MAKFRGTMAERGERNGERISMQRCKDILNRKKNQYSDSDILAIRDFLYELAKIDYGVFMHNENKEASLNENPDSHCSEPDPTTDTKHAA
ncbi:MAG: hypothetical protein ACHQRM_10410 [Bacteroidia bacterium]